LNDDDDDDDDDDFISVPWKISEVNVLETCCVMWYSEGTGFGIA